MSSTVQTVAPATEPVCITDVKEQLSIDDDSDDQMLIRFIETARRILEKRSWSAFITQTFVTRFDNCFPPEFWLPHWPLQSVSSVTYLDNNGDSQTLASSQYTTDIYTRPGNIVPAYNVTWPITRSVANAVTLTYVAGHGDEATDVPSPIRDAIVSYVGFLYCSRDGAGDSEEAIQRSLSIMMDYTAYSEDIKPLVK